MYADRMTKSIDAAVEITKKRRIIQEEYNKKHNITPKTIKRQKAASLLETFGMEEVQETIQSKPHIHTEDISKKIEELEKKMRKAAKDLRFEEAAAFRDQIHSYSSIELI